MRRLRKLERQMAVRSIEDENEPFLVRQDLLAPPLVTPDSPRPQKLSNCMLISFLILTLCLKKCFFKFQ
jgi:hypothetical protein